ncbi:sugar transferase [Dankookia sp. GCM10030260]|uniref:sugar transferase n=1 Tax=Dankookia sp. GCM10030260 TaxID=3273390 RepID=UPI00360BA3B2
MSDIYFSGRASSSTHGFVALRGRDRRAGLESHLKRGLDLLGAGTLLALALPLMLLIALIVRGDGGPILFRHPRVGRGGRAFPCLKFRSMVTDADKRLAALLATDPVAAEEWATRRKLPRDPRITRIGGFLRRTSLDELPQLLNVLRGEMSLVGPRPVVREELDLHYSPAAAAAYCEMRPGITGLWQISGRSDTTYAERVGLDSRYVRDWAIGLDIAILLKTIPAVLRRRGAV